MLTQTTSVVPKKRVPPCLVRPHLLSKKASLLRSRKRPARTPPSTFLFLPIHLSNSPGIMAIPLPGTPGSRRSPRLPTEIGRLVTPSVRSFAGAPSRRKAGGAPLWRALYEGLHGLVNTESIRFPRNFVLWTCCDAPAPVPPVANPLRRTGATFLPRCLHRGKASGHGKNQRVLELGALTLSLIHI